MIQPHEQIIHDDCRLLHLASAYSPEEAASECGFLLDEVAILEEWYRPRELSAEEIADENVQSFMDPNWEPGDLPVEIEYLRCSPDHPEAACYLRVTEKEM